MAFFLTCLMAVIGMASPCHAHNAFPLGHFFARPGATVKFIVYEPPGQNCSAKVTISADPANLVDLSPDSPDLVTYWEYAIGVKPDASGSVLIRAHYQGEAFFGGKAECDGEGNLDLALTIKEPAQETAANAPFSETGGDPVNTLTGELFFHEPPDLNLGGPMPLYFQRYYASNLDGSTMSSNLGNNWRHNFDWTLSRAGSQCLVINPEGRVVSFEKTGDSWVQQSGKEILYQLFEQTDGTHTFYSPRDGRFYTFDVNGVLAKIEDGRGNAHYLFYSEYEGFFPGKLMEISDTEDGSGRNLEFGYDSYADSRKVTRVTEYQGSSLGRSVYFTYTGDDLTKAQDPLSKYTTYTYDASGARPGLMTAKIRPLGNIPFTQTYDAQGRVATQADSANHVSSFVYDTVSGVTAVTDPLNRIMQHTYASRALTQWRDRLGNPVSVAYDDHGRRKSVTDRLGAVTSLTFHAASGRIASRTDAENQTTTYSYTGRNQNGFTLYDITGISYPDGSSVGFTYDASGNVLSYTDRAGKTWSYTYNARGQILTTENPAGGVTTATYNADGTQARLKDELNQETLFTYDNKRRLTRVTHPDTTYRSYTYDSNDRITSVTDERSMTTYYVYDDNGRLTRITDRAGYVVVKNVAYDGNDRPISWTDALDKISYFTYDEMGRMASTQNPLGNTVQFGYDEAGRLITVRDPDGHLLQTAYDREGIPLSMTGPSSQAWNFATDRLGRTKEVTSPLSRQTRLSYDALGRLSAWSNAVAQTSLAYDPQGLSGISLSGGISSSYGHDDLGEISRVTDAAGHLLNRSYDAAGRLTSQTDRLGNTISYTYDNRNRISAVTLPAGTLQITHDAAGNVTRRYYSDATDLNYTYDNNGRLLTANGLSLQYDSNGNMKNSNGLVITRDAAGRVAAVRMVPTNATPTVNYTYNGRGLVTRVSDWLGGSTDLEYDAEGRLTRLARPNGTSVEYLYDADGILIRLTEKSGAQTLSAIDLTRDAAGNVSAATRDVPLPPDPSTGKRSFTYNEEDQIIGYTYDGMGRLTADDARTYAWDLASRLTSYAGGGNTVTFAYDGFGMRTSRTADGVTRNYVWNYALGLPSISIVRDASNTTNLYYYVHLPNGQLLHRIEVATGARNFYHFDETGTTLFLTDDSGAVTDRYGVQPYGATVSEGTTDNPFIFQGAWGVMAEGNGLHYIRARYYDSASARFISKDPVESLHPLKINPYQYAVSNPLRYGDPTGQKEMAGAFGGGSHSSLGGVNGLSIKYWLGDFGLLFDLGLDIKTETGTDNFSNLLFELDTTRASVAVGKTNDATGITSAPACGQSSMLSREAPAKFIDSVNYEQFKSRYKAENSEGALFDSVSCSARKDVSSAPAPHQVKYNSIHKAIAKKWYNMVANAYANNSAEWRATIKPKKHRSKYIEFRQIGGEMHIGFSYDPETMSDKDALAKLAKDVAKYTPGWSRFNPGWSGAGEYIMRESIYYDYD